MIRVAPLPSAIHRGPHQENPLDAVARAMLTCLNESCDGPQRLKIDPLGPSQSEPVEEWEHSSLELGRSRDFEVEDTITAATHRSDAEHSTEELWKLWSEL